MLRHNLENMDEIECPVCKEEFGGDVVRVTMRACQHPICGRCIRVMASLTPRTTSAVKCPICRCYWSEVDRARSEEEAYLRNDLSRYRQLMIGAGGAYSSDMLRSMNALAEYLYHNGIKFFPDGLDFPRLIEAENLLREAWENRIVNPLAPSEEYLIVDTIYLLADVVREMDRHEEAYELIRSANLPRGHQHHSRAFYEMMINGPLGDGGDDE